MIKGPSNGGEEVKGMLHFLDQVTVYLKGTRRTMIFEFFQTISNLDFKNITADVNN